MLPKVAVVGLGRIGFTEELDPKRPHPCTHVGVWLDQQARGNAILSAVVDTSAEARNKFMMFKQQQGIDTNVYDSMTKLYNTKEEIDIVVIATPTWSHCFDVLDALMTPEGVPKPKLIFLEKPLAESLPDAWRIISKCEEESVQICINHTRRWDPRYTSPGLTNFLKSIEPKHCTFTYPGPALRDGSHAFDLLRRWFGEAKTVQTTRCMKDNWMIRKNQGFNDYNYSGFMIFGSETDEEDDVSVYYNGAVPTSYLLYEVDIIGEKGRVIIKDNGAQTTFYVPSESKKYSDINELHIYKEEMVTYHTALSVATDNILNKIRDPLKFQLACKGIDGYKAIEVAHALFHSWIQGTQIALPLDMKRHQEKIHSW
jgi:predicted dehydrogenase